MSQIARLTAAVISIAALAPAIAAAKPGSKPADQTPERRNCFFLSDMQGSRPLDSHAILFRVGSTDIYKLSFEPSCPQLTYPDPKLVLTPLSGVNSICDAIDLDVRVGQNGGFDTATACIPSDLKKLTPAETAAIPKRALP